MGETLKKLPWPTLIAIVFWYCLCGWCLSIVRSPLSYWFAVVLASSLLAAAVSRILLLAVTATLGLAFISVPLALSAMVVKGNAQVVAFANQLGGGIWFFIFALLIAAFWFSPLFLSKYLLGKQGFNRVQIFRFLAVAGWLGIGLGWVVGRFF